MSQERTKHPKLAYSSQTNLLEENIYKYSLQDVFEPNLFRDQFEARRKI